MSDASPVKADLLCGVYQTEQGLPLVLPSVKLVALSSFQIKGPLIDLNQAKKKIYEDPTWNHEYPSSHLGEAPFLDRSKALLFGDSAEIIIEKR